jgi:hypothetical protein
MTEIRLFPVRLSLMDHVFTKYYFALSMRNHCLVGSGRSFARHFIVLTYLGIGKTKKSRGTGAGTKAHPVSVMARSANMFFLRVVWPYVDCATK